MTDALPQDPDELEALAGEYVLGLLEPQARAQIEQAAEANPVLAAAIAGWSARLEPLAGLAPPSEPSDLLWRRITRDLPRRRAPGGRAVGRPASGWKWAAIGGYALAAGLAMVLLSARRVEISLRVTPERPAPVVVVANAPPRPPPPKVETPPKVSPPLAPRPPPPAEPPRPDRALALLTAPGETRPALKIHVSGGMVHVEALRPVSAGAGRQLDLWVWPEGEKTPILLGAIGGDGGALPLRVGIDDGTPVMVTSEPAGVPNTGQAGRTLFAGTLALLD
jgi:anti-sigma-K factor RskA